MLDCVDAAQTCRHSWWLFLSKPSTRWLTSSSPNGGTSHKQAVFAHEGGREGDSIFFLRVGRSPESQLGIFGRECNRIAGGKEANENSLPSSSSPDATLESNPLSCSSLYKCFGNVVLCYYLHIRGRGCQRVAKHSHYLTEANFKLEKILGLSENHVTWVK